MPKILSVTTVSPATLTIRWTTGSYLLGDVSACVFQSWSVELARIQDGRAGDYVVAPTCSSLPQTARECDQAVVGHGVYFARVRQTCTDSSFDTLPSAVFYGIKSRPIAAIQPIRINCSHFYELVGVDVMNGTTLNAGAWVNQKMLNVADWVPGVSHNCSFTWWEVQMKYHSRNIDGYLDHLADGTDWFSLCGINDFRNITSCVFPIRTNREYSLRVRERCDDHWADSQWTENLEVCWSAGVNAEIPTNLTVSDIGTSSFRISWEASEDTDFDSCVFKAWDVQAKPVDLHWPGYWNNKSIEGDVYESGMTPDVFDESGNLTESGVAFGYWKKVITYEQEWLDVDQSEYQLYRVTPSKLIYDIPTLNGTMHTEEDYNRSWNETLRYDNLVNISGMVYGCSSYYRNVTDCLLRVASVGAIRYDIRLRETCADSSFDSAWTYLDASSLPITMLPAVLDAKPALNPSVEPIVKSFLGFRPTSDLPVLPRVLR